MMALANEEADAMRKRRVSLAGESPASHLSESVEPFHSIALHHGAVIESHTITARSMAKGMRKPSIAAILSPGSTAKHAAIADCEACRLAETYVRCRLLTFAIVPNHIQRGQGAGTG